MTKEHLTRYKERISIVFAFIFSFSFFQFAYPYHLIRREQQTLFLFDWDYIRQTYRGFGWLAAFVSDFLEQFFHLPTAGPIVIASLLTLIGTVTYMICSKFMNSKQSLLIAVIVFIWSFMRETGNLYITRYTVVVLLYLITVLVLVRIGKGWLKPVIAAFLLPFAVWAYGEPMNRHYGRLWNTPKFGYERIIALDVEVSRERWDKVLELSRKDLYMVEASYCYNLAQAVKGNLGQALFDHSQDHDKGLLLRVATNNSTFTNCLAGEAWYHLGAMTIAEQSSIIALQASPKHTGTRFIKRLAQVNLITGQEATAQKYLNLLSKTLFYGKWARSMTPANQTQITRLSLSMSAMGLAHNDFVHHSNETRAILLGLLESNPSNTLAHNYLLCYDLLNYDLETFMEDYSKSLINGRIYHEAVLIWLSQHNRLTEQEANRYGVDARTNNRMQRFAVNPKNYRNTYWYYYLNALQESEQ